MYCECGEKVILAKLHVRTPSVGKTGNANAYYTQDVKQVPRQC